MHEYHIVRFALRSHQRTFPQALIDTKMHRKTVKRYTVKSCTYVMIIIACNAIDEISNTYEYKMTKYVE